MQKTIYIIDTYFYNTKENAIQNIAYIDKKQAIAHIENKLTDIEKKQNIKNKKRGLLWWGEFISKDKLYTIRELTIQEK